jgi:hypothetical protein
MVGTEIDHKSQARRLPIDAEHLARVVARLRLDVTTAALSWSLGERGNCEVDVSFAPFAHPHGIGFTTTALVWNPFTAARLDVRLEPCADGESQLTMRPAEPATRSWADANRGDHELVEAALEELAQELLWQHSRL